MSIALRLATAVWVLGSVLHAVYYLHLVQDDAFISFRYAMNWIDFGSLSFNGPGFERVEGYSNFLFVMLLAAAYACGAPPLWAAKVLGVTSLAASLAGTARLVDLLLGRVSPWRLLAVGGLGTSAFFVSWSVQGLETPLVSALLVWAMVALARTLRTPRDRRAALLTGLLFGMLALARPETGLFGALALVSFALAVGVRCEARSFAALALGFLVPFALQFGFRFAYYGAIVANTYGAKVGGEIEVARGLGYLLAYAEAKGIALCAVLASCVAFAWVRKAQRVPGARSLPLSLAVMLGGYAAFIVSVGGDFMGGFRFVMHGLPLLAALGTWGVATVCEAVVARPRSRAIRAVLAVGALALLAAGLHSNLMLERALSRGTQGALRAASRGAGFYALRRLPRGPHFTAGEWLARSLPPAALIAVSEAGIMPFESGLPTLDYLGLNDRTIAQLRHAPRAALRVATHVLDAQPSAIAMLRTVAGGGANAALTGRLAVERAMEGEPRFAEGYRLAKRIPLEPARKPSRGEIAIYVRRDVNLAPVTGVFRASPNRIPAGRSLGATKLQWSGWALSDARVVVARDGGAERLFATGATGERAADFIQSGHRYVFRLYADDGSLLATETVEREE